MMDVRYERAIRFTLGSCGAPFENDGRLCRRIRC